jgi:nicotinate phosphoribosyltransferase
MPEGVFSLLDTDLYKLTMHCAVLKYFPTVGKLLVFPIACGKWHSPAPERGYPRTTISSDVGAANCFFRWGADVTYSFTNRTRDMKLTRAAYGWLLEQINSTWQCKVRSVLVGAAISMLMDLRTLL